MNRTTATLSTEKKKEDFLVLFYDKNPSKLEQFSSHCQKMYFPNVIAKLVTFLSLKQDE